MHPALRKLTQIIIKIGEESFVMRNMLLSLLIYLLLQPVCKALSSPRNPYDDAYNKAFSLSTYQKARALDTSQCLDASRFHFQILFVDDDNSHGRIAEGVMARIAEYNDAMSILFPAS